MATASTSLPTRPSRSRAGRLSSSVASATFILSAVMASACPGSPGTERLRGRAVDPVRTAPTVVGTNWDGQEFDWKAQRGKAIVLFFGYTFCPDICPFTLGRLRQVKTALGKDAERLSVVFVSVDPGRDSVKRLADYVPSFDEDFYGLHVTGDGLFAVTKAYDITVRRGPSLGKQAEADLYSVDHTGTLFLIDPSGRQRVHHTQNASVEDLVADIRTLLAEKTR